MRNHQSLPRFLTQFVGRAQEIETLKGLVNSAQLVTVTGISGLGKTRLSIEVARQMEDRFRDGVCFVSLEGLSDPSAVIQAMAGALSLTADSQVDVKAQLSFALSHRDMLLVLDAAEGVVSDEFAAWMSEILTSPSKRLLVTSQQPLRLQGEQFFPLAPLALPTTENPGDIQEVDSVSLFAVCVRRHLPDWEVTPDNAPTLAEICRLLDGIPLALELAAGQLMPGGERALLEELKAGVDRLVATDEWDRPLHHRSLMAALERAFARLSKPERQVLERLSVLDSGSFFDTAVEPITAVDDGRLIAQALHRAGLLQVERSEIPCSGVELSPDAKLAAPEHMRYRMLNTVRHCGQSRIASHVRDEVEERISLYYLQEAKRQALYAGPETRAAVAWFRVETLNLRQGCQWALKRKDLELLCEYAMRLGDIEWEQGERGMIQELWRTAIEIAERDPSLQPKLGQFWASLREAGFRDIAKDALAEALAHAQATNDTNMILGHFRSMSQIELEDGFPHRAREYLEQLQATGLTANRPEWEARLLCEQGLVAWAEGQFAIGEDYLRRSLTLYEQHGLNLGASGTLDRLASLIEARGDLASAVGLYEEAMERLLREGRTLPLCGHLLAQAKRYLRLNQPEIAEAHLRESICEGRKMGMSRHLMEGLNKLAMEFLCPRGMFQDARSLLQEAMSLAVQIGHRRIYGGLLNSSALLAFSEGNLDEALRQAIESLRSAEELNHASDQAHARLVLGQVETARGAFAQALPHLTEARRIFLTDTRRILQANKKPENMARCLLAFGEFYRRQGQWQEAEACYREAESYATREDLRCHILHAWALLHEARGQRDVARTKWENILPICRVWKLRLAQEVEAALRRLETTIPTGGFVLHLFGPFELRYNGQPVPLQSSQIRPFARELWAYLASSQGQWRERDLICEALREHARNGSDRRLSLGSLHAGISKIHGVIRSICPDVEVLPCKDGRYCFDPDGVVWNDLREFNQALKNASSAHRDGDFERAFNLWAFASELYQRGELLADWRYSAWCQDQRHSTHEQWLDALEHWSKAQYQRGEYEAGLAMARRILTLDPAVETAHQLTMKCLARLGRRDEALRQYEDCARALREVNKSPSHETQQLYRQIRGK